MEDPDFEFEFARNSPDWTIQELLDLMAWGREQGMSDLILTSSDRPWMRLDGVWRGLGRRRVQLGELAALLNRLTRNEAAGAMVGTGLELDFGCELPKGRGRRIRFRGNASAVANGWSTGVTMTLRSLPDFPPPLETLEIEPELLAGLFPENGLVLVTGVMGSGKSTLLASVLRRLAEGGRRHIATYEAPIEFDLGGLPGRLSPVEQSEVPRHCEGFTAAARNVTRRAADVVLMGESRDCETIRGLMEAAEIGVAAYTTVHTRSVADTPGRIISLFSARERPAMAASLLSALRVVVQQRLYPSPDGGRRAVREFLALSPDMRAMLQKERPARLAPALDEMVESSGQTLEAAVGREVGLGRLSPEVLELVRSERRGRRDRHER
jgi:defect-in-organelle-trafficking protein DotB